MRAVSPHPAAGPAFCSRSTAVSEDWFRLARAARSSSQLIVSRECRAGHDPFLVDIDPTIGLNRARVADYFNSTNSAMKRLQGRFPSINAEPTVQHFDGRSCSVTNCSIAWRPQ